LSTSGQSSPWLQEIDRTGGALTTKWDDAAIEAYIEDLVAKAPPITPQRWAEICRVIYGPASSPDSHVRKRSSPPREPVIPAQRGPQSAEPPAEPAGCTCKGQSLDRLPGLYSLDDLAAYFDVGARTVEKWANSKELPGRKIGRRWQFTDDDVREFLAATATVSEVEIERRRLRRQTVTREDRLAAVGLPPRSRVGRPAVPHRGPP
jgi:excisionase family DNA binding protein